MRDNVDVMRDFIFFEIMGSKVSYDEDRETKLRMDMTATFNAMNDTVTKTSYEWSHKGAWQAADLIRQTYDVTKAIEEIMFYRVRSIGLFVHVPFVKPLGGFTGGRWPE